MRNSTNQDGLTLLITLLLMSILLSISASLLNITLKQYRLAGIAKDSEMAFQAASAGIECGVYYDVQTGLFDVDADGDTRPEVSLTCMGDSSTDVEPSNNNTILSGEEQRFEFEWQNSPSDSFHCTKVSVYKYSLEDEALPGTLNMLNGLGKNENCPRSEVGNPVECTVVRSRGYNLPCNQLNNPRAVERELIQRY